MLALPPQQPGAEGVESANGQGVAVGADESGETVPHFPCRFVGKCHCQDAVGADAVDLHEVGDAMGDDAGLAAARSGHDKQRTVNGLDSFALRRVQAVK